LPDAINHEGNSSMSLSPSELRSRLNRLVLKVNRVVHTTTEDDLARALATELGQGVELDPENLKELADGITKGGAGGTAIASMLVAAIAELGANVEQIYHHLTPNKSAGQDGLEGKISEIEEQIGKLKELAKKLDLVNQKIKELMPKFLAALGDDPPATRNGGLWRWVGLALIILLAIIAFLLMPGKGPEETTGNGNDVTPSAAPGPSATAETIISQPQSGPACSCEGVDFICKNADGSTASAQFNVADCGGTGGCECRGQDLYCPDGSYGQFNPQCTGDGSSNCQCVYSDPCQTLSCPGYYDTCTGKACTP
jgi:hypothetical protein